MRHRRGFTLVELLVVIAIIAVLLALLVPAVGGARESARRNQCSNNMKQLALAIQSYEVSNSRLPPAGFYNPPDGDLTSMSWNVGILPQIEEGSLSGQLDRTGLFSSIANENLAALAPVSTFLCPSQTTQRSVDPQDVASNGQFAYTSHYQCNPGPIGNNAETGAAYPRFDPAGPSGLYAIGGVMLYNRGVAVAEIRDGTSNTILLGELSWQGAPSYRSWLRGTSLNDSEQMMGSGKNIMWGVNSRPATTPLMNDQPLGSMHPGGAVFGFAGGSVTYVDDSISLGVYMALASRAGGELSTAFP